MTGQRGNGDVALNTLGGGVEAGRSRMNGSKTDRRRLLGQEGSRRVDDGNDGRSWILFCLVVFFVITLVHSYCFFLHISDKHGAFRTVLCEKRGKRKRKEGKKKNTSYGY